MRKMKTFAVKEITMGTQRSTNNINGVLMNDLQDTVDAIRQDPDLAKCQFHIHNKWIDSGHNRTTIRSFHGAKQEIPHDRPFSLHADEPHVLGSSDQGPNPVEHLLNALAGCVTSSLVYHAALRGIRIESLESEVEGDLDLRGFLDLTDEVRKGYSNIRIKFKVKTNEQDLDRLKQLAEYSPVYDVVTNGTNVDITMERK